MAEGGHKIKLICGVASGIPGRLDLPPQRNRKPLMIPRDVGGFQLGVYFGQYRITGSCERLLSKSSH